MDLYVNMILLGKRYYYYIIVMWNVQNVAKTFDLQFIDLMDYKSQLSLN